MHEVDVVDPSAITDAEARRAGHVDADAVRATLAPRRTPSARARVARPDATSRVYRVRVTYAGADPRAGLRKTRLDRRGIAAMFGRETLPWKSQVRRLKELGLTESLPIGYRLSPRGRQVRDAARRRRGNPPARNGV